MTDTIVKVPHRLPAARWSTAIRWGAAIVFVVFGAGKFVNHGSELVSFRQYALPAPAVWAYVIGVLEIVGGLLLASGRLVRLAALALAGDMVGAIVVSGIGRGEGISLTLAPVLLVAMIFLIRAGTPDRCGDRGPRAAQRRTEPSDGRRAGSRRRSGRGR